LENHEPEARIHGWMTLKILVPTCIYCLNCTKFGQLILRKITKIVATRCPILRLKRTKFDFGWGSTPDPTGGAYSALPDPIAGFKGPTSKGGREGRGEGRGWKGRRGRYGGAIQFLASGRHRLSYATALRYVALRYGVLTEFLRRYIKILELRCVTYCWKLGFSLNRK